MSWDDSDNDYKISNYDHIDGGIITISNAINNSAQCLTLMEKRLIFYCIAKVNSINSSKSQTKEFKVSVMDFADFFKLNVDSTYQALREITMGMMKKQWEYITKDGKGNETIHRRQWLSGCDYKKSEGWVNVTFSKDVAPHLTLLRNKFTTYRLSQASGLRSLHTWRLLEKLMQFTNADGKGWWTVDIEDFCRTMEATEKQKANFGKIRTQIIEPAIIELTEKDGWLIDYQAIKAGRKVISLRFDFSRLRKQTEG